MSSLSTPKKNRYGVTEGAVTEYGVSVKFVI